MRSVGKSIGTTERSLLWLSGKRTSRVILVIGSVLLGLILLGLLVFLLIQDGQAKGEFPDGSRIGGVYVGGLTEDQALEKCRQELSELESKPLELRIDDEVYDISPAEIGLTLDYEAMVDQAYQKAWNVNVLERMVRRFLRKPRNVDLPIVTAYDEEKVASFVRTAMDSIERPPSNAYIDISTGIGKVVPAKDGRKADYEQLLADAEEALKTPERFVNVQVTRSPATETGEEFGKYILVNLGAHTLSLYDRDTLIASYAVATGSEEWPTAIGQWAVVKMEKNPTWYNRGSEWAEEMPDSIPPGPGNPLGTRAITLNGGGVLIHGTSSGWSIGRSVSHGCIRMYMGDVESLYEHVFVGMPVYIIKKAGEPGFDCSKKPWWM